MKAHPRTLLYVYFAGTAVAFIWIFLNFATWCQDDNEVELLRKNLQLLQHKSKTEKNQIVALRRQLDSLKSEQLKTFEGCIESQNATKGLPIIYLITPTHGRLEQKADLTRLSYTLRHVPNIHWIVVEDAEKKTTIVSKFLQDCKVTYTHLNAKTPDNVKLKGTDPNWLKPRGVYQRNAGLRWLRENAVASQGVLYFADDDNTYDLKVFKEMRFTRKVSVWPVGLVGYLRYESPVIKNKKVVGWYTYWKPQRPFAMDMAGFAVNLQLVLSHPAAAFRVTAGRGNQESDLLTQLQISLDDLEPKADYCTKVLVWHTRTEKSSLKNEDKMLKIHGHNSDLSIEV